MATNSKALNAPRGLESEWAALQQLAQQPPRIARQLSNQADWVAQCQVDAGPLRLDFSRQAIDPAILEQLVALADQAQLQQQIQALFNGAQINQSEQRAALHSSLRADNPDSPNFQQVQDELQKLQHISEQIRSGDWLGFSGKPIKHIVNIGIGGSDLGPCMASQALQRWRQADLSLHFVSNIDPDQLASILAGLDPAQTLFVIVSKSFSTQETLTNASLARDWLQQAAGDRSIAGHLLAVTSNPQKAVSWGIAEQHCLQFWSWVGGRYSIWSAAAASLAIAIGMPAFKAFLAGARQLDQHFLHSDWRHNAPVIMALLEIWNVNFLHAQSLAVVPYCQRLDEFPAYLQQLCMESNGKSIDIDGNHINYATSPVLFGCAGSNGQHSFFQLLHQGTQQIPVDFILPINNPQLDNAALQHSQTLLIANAIAQGQALLQGRQDADIENYRQMPGNRPSSFILCDELTPETLGALIAMYEHKTFACAAIWRINPFDQWGVELGKQLSRELETIIAGEQNSDQLDRATANTLNYFFQHRRGISKPSDD